MLGAVFCDIHPVKLLYKVTLTQDSPDYCKTAGRNNAFISKLDDDIFSAHNVALLYHVFSVCIITFMAWKAEQISGFFVTRWVHILQVDRNPKGLIVTGNSYSSQI